MGTEYKIKPLKVALFGITNSGKKQAIEEFLPYAEKYGQPFVHLSPADMIRERIGDKKLKDMTDGEKKKLVKEVRSEIFEIGKTNNIIVEEHYCFPSTVGGQKLENGYCDEKLPFELYRPPGCKNDYEIVFPRFELEKYNLIVCMEIDPDIILERFRLNKGLKHNPLITKEEIIEWKNVERIGCTFDDLLIHKKRYRFVHYPTVAGEELWNYVRDTLEDHYYRVMSEEHN